MDNNITLALAKAYVNEKMSGVSGVKGDTGVSVTDVAINSNNHLIITLSDKSSIDAGLIETKPMDEVKPGLPLLEKLAKGKKDKNTAERERRAKMGVRIPTIY